MGIQTELDSIIRQLENKREDMLLIQERKSQYVLDTDIPLELVKEERETEKEIALLETRVQDLRRELEGKPGQPPAVTPPQMVSPPKKRRWPWVAGGLSAGCLCLAAAVILGMNLLGGKKQQDAALQPSAGGNTPTPALGLNGSTPSAPAGPAPATSTPPGAARVVDNPATATPSGAAFAPATLTVTSTPPASVNLTNNKEGGYSDISLLFDQKGILHLIFTSRLPRGRDYYHQQMSPGGQWSAPENLTSDFEYFWSNPVLALHPDGYICVLWNGNLKGQRQADYKLCQKDPGGAFSQRETWQQEYTAGSFSALLLQDGSVAAAFNIHNSAVYFHKQSLEESIAAAVNPNLVEDSAGGYHLIWHRQGKPYSLEYRASADGGATWSPAERLTSDATAPDWRFDLAADAQGNLHLAWPAFDNTSLYYRRWTRAAGWGETQKIGLWGCDVKLAVNRAGLARVVSGCGRATFFSEQTPDGGWLSDYQVAAAGSPLDIAVDANDQIHLVYLKDNDLFYTTFKTRWTGK